MNQTAANKDELFRSLLSSEYPLRRPENSFRVVDGFADVRNHFVPDRHEQLNQTATFVLELCDGEHSIIDIWRQMLEEFEVEDNKESLRSIVRLIRYLQRTYILFPCSIRNEQRFDPGVPVDEKNSAVRI